MKSIEPRNLQRVDERLRADLEAARPRPSGDLHARILAAVAAGRRAPHGRRWPLASIAAGLLVALGLILSLSLGRDGRESEAARLPALPDWTALFELPALELKLRLDDPLLTELRLLAQDTGRATQHLVESLPAPLRPRGESLSRRRN